MPFRRFDRRMPRVSFAELVDDALLVARAGVRQKVKNVILVHALRDGAPFDAAYYTNAARAELEAMATESDDDAQWLERELQYARGRHFAAVTARDYVDRDVPALRLRMRVQHALAERLRDLADDDAELTTLIADARELALDEIAAASAAVPRAEGPRTVTGSAKRIALSDLRDDLLDLAKEVDAHR